MQYRKGMDRGYFIDVYVGDNEALTLGRRSIRGVNAPFSGLEVCGHFILNPVDRTQKCC
jgi:hypothetical protein